MNNILEINNLTKEFHLHEQNMNIKGCAGVSMALAAGGFTGIVGRSGSGKSTVLRCVYRTYLPTSGEIWYDSDRYGRIDLAAANERQIITLRQEDICRRRSGTSTQTRSPVKSGCV